MQALIDSEGRVIELAATPFQVHSAFVWQDVGASGAQPGWTATETNGTWTFTAPVVPPVPLQPAIRAQLAELDTSIPRGLEDMWAASGFDTTKLPAATQAKLAQKGTLRAQLAALIAAGTP